MRGLRIITVGLTVGWCLTSALCAAWPVATTGHRPPPKTQAAAKKLVPKEHWSFQPLKTYPLPKVKKVGWVRSPVDCFILGALENRGLSPAPAAGRHTLIRRLYFDLLGLPPRPEEVETFVTDRDPRAYEKLVDRLLASPHYGERWGRHWLDVARYADSDGQESDHDRPTAYHYRDLVIRALNDDLPYNTFVRWQLAGDEYQPDNPLAVSATGFIAAGTRAVLPDNLLEEERIRERYNELDDMVTTTGIAFLGMTMGCARCHDHKYDPIPTRDYYRMSAAFNAGNRSEVPLLPWAEVVKRREAEREWKGRLDAAKKAGDMAAVKALEANKPPAVPTVFAMADAGAEPRESWLLDRGDFHRRLEPVKLGFLTALTRNRPASAYWADARAHGVRNDTTYQRRAMAEWMTDTEQGAGALLARVMVNRLWQGHFGEGIVRTVNDFGKRSDAPSHPALLEWLASELVRGGWRLKPVHRMIVLSATYRQGTALSLRNAKIDPENRLLWRRRPRRIEAELLRDTMLSVAGTLNTEMYGKAFKPPIQPEAMLARNVKDPYPENVRDTPETRRRSIYMFHKRVVPYPLLQAFDSPDTTVSCGRRNVTTVAPQALAVLNEPFVRLRAGEFARRLRAEAGEDAAAQARLAYRLALGREPSTKELDASVAFIKRQGTIRAARGERAEARLSALTDFAQVVYGLNEFVYVD
jgi:hypothetical protein